MSNKASSRITYLQTLHPEKGSDALSRQQGEYAGKWDAVWTEAVLIDEDTFNHHQQNGTNSVPTGGTENKTGEFPLNKYNCFVLLFGRVFVFTAVIATFALELSSAICFILAALFNSAATAMSETGGLAIFLHLIFALLSTVLMIMDRLYLLVGTFVTEILALVTFILCALFGGIASGLEWHQLVRRVCHLTRWAFRDFQEKWKCLRKSPTSEDSSHESTGNGNNVDDTINQEDDVIAVGPEDVVIEVEPEISQVEQLRHKDVPV